MICGDIAQSNRSLEKGREQSSRPFSVFFKISGSLQMQ